MKQKMSHLVVALACAIGLAGASVSLAAQTEKKPAQAKSGASHTVTGCLQKSGDTYTLTNEGKGPKTVTIDGTATGVDLSPHVGHKIAITGTEVSGAKKGEHHMHVDSMKMVSTSCS
jgi:hypothetical protein